MIPKSCSPSYAASVSRESVSYTHLDVYKRQAHTYVAGAKLVDGTLATSGGRVTGTTAVADTLEQAIAEAYRLACLLYTSRCV